ncbi:MAG: hypothetical protein JXR91_00290 [Deltaproteobacteria bacterium]|nr:hypothetical protein [Deltaproteobacteria bacterium]
MKNRDNSEGKNQSFGKYKQIDFALGALLIFAVAATVLYRFIASIGLYASIGTEGILPVFANVGTFFMILTGTLAGFMLPFYIVKLISNINIKGLWWRSFIILISPIYILTILWSILTELSPWILILAIGGVMITFIILTSAVLLSEAAYSIKRLFFALTLTYILALSAWIILDFLQISWALPIGRYARSAYKIAEVAALLLPVYSYFTIRKYFSRDEDTGYFNIPALIIALLITIAAGAIILYIQLISSTTDIISSSPFLIRVLYRTLGMTLAFPYGVFLFIISFFFAALLFFTLVVPTKKYRPDYKRVNLAIGMGLICISGLQPVVVYQYAVALLGFVALTGIIIESDTEIEKFDEKSSLYELKDLNELNNELDGSLKEGKIEDN